jgi:hypothetical protein
MKLPLMLLQVARKTEEFGILGSDSVLKNVPSLSRGARDREASSKPYRTGAVGFVEAARFWGGQGFVPSTI